ncbi:MAG: hypothetical protein ACJAVK_001075 [Akkermansiaceae bacterium]
MVVPTGEANAVDFFVKRKLKEAGLEMAKPANAEELIRRISFDLHGLPPAPDGVRDFKVSFQADEDSAVEELIERLLGSPRYGERWGQHWLDIVRYSDSDGYRADDFRPDAFRYRDYVVRAFNDDKRYDDFVREQLAGDEIVAGEPERMAATGFLRHGVYEWNQRNAEMQREIMINEITNVTGEVFMGMGIGCAQCHDHKFDPILQKDYFALQAFLSSVYWPDDRHHETKDGVSKYEEDRRKWEEATAEIRAEMRSLVAEGERRKYQSRVQTFPPKVQEIFAKPWGEKSSYDRQISFLVERQARREVRTQAKPEQVLKKESVARLRYQELSQELGGFDHLKPPSLSKAFLSTDTGREAAEVKLKGKVIDPAFLEVLGGEKPTIKIRENTTGRRTALADWIVRRDHPTTARVMVNRIWQYHFGKGIAASPNDFGMLGEKPTHPELLDWLAGEFMAGGWKMKRMHRLVMTSQAYRQTARFEPSHLQDQTDPDNHLLWRFPPKRLSAEQIRDAMLAVSGELKHRNGGAAEGSATPVRSIYVKKMRNTPDRILQCFDSPSGFASEPDRQNTTTPTQSLLMANSEWPLARARALAGRVLGAKLLASEEELERAFALAWGRKATAEEVSAGMAFLRSQRKMTGEERKKNEESQERGLIALGDDFEGAEELLGDGVNGAFSLVPGSDHEGLEFRELRLNDEQFTVMAVVRLEGIHRDAKVNTLAAQWNGDQEKGGWAMGVTSTMSAYGERNFIVQLVGQNADGNLEYEVVASGLEVPLKVPVMMAVSIGSQADGTGVVRFFLRDLSKSGGAVKTTVVGHKIVAGILGGESEFSVGTRKGGSHFWKGSVARLAVIPEALGELDFQKKGVIDLKIREVGVLPDGMHWTSGKKGPEKHQDVALVDFCHALLSSNEFLYLH